MTILFEDRRDAGKQLANALKALHYENSLFLALPRGGVIIADEVAKKFHRNLDVVIARKIGAPDQPEFGIGAISEDEHPSFNPSVISFLNINDQRIHSIIDHEIDELHRRIELYRDGRHLPDLKKKTVVVIDDGLATGVTAVAAARFLRTLHPEKLVLAVPLGPDPLGKEITNAYDDIVCIHALPNMQSVGMWYRQFYQVDDKEVQNILEQYKGDNSNDLRRHT